MVLTANLQTTNTENVGTVLLSLSNYAQFFISNSKDHVEMKTLIIKAAYFSILAVGSDKFFYGKI